MKLIRHITCRPAVVIAPFLTLFVGLSLYINPYRRVHHGHPTQTALSLPHRIQSFDGSWNYTRDANNLLLTQAQCDQAFPDLFVEIDRARDARSDRPITARELDSVTTQSGYVRAMIYKQRLYVIKTGGESLSREIATLFAINRALVSTSEPLPNIEFLVSTESDMNDVPIWTYARRPSDESFWLVPDFEGWAWPGTEGESIKNIFLAAQHAGQSDSRWKNKSAQILWRGEANPRTSVMDQLLTISKEKPWANVELVSESQNNGNDNGHESISEYCKYKFLAHIEKTGYSEMLKYLQLCQSVIVSHRLESIQHHFHLLRSSGSKQNFVEVERDWSDLPERMDWLLKHDDEAKRIADNNVEVFRERYLTQAAEVCYWRRLMREYSKVSPEPKFFTEDALIKHQIRKPAAVHIPRLARASVSGKTQPNVKGDEEYDFEASPLNSEVLQNKAEGAGNQTSTNQTFDAATIEKHKADIYESILPDGSKKGVNKAPKDQVEQDEQVPNMDEL
ncbi:CAZyme family GT90 [Penicillium macrosclerotiorum]|uniref:CAZyme family GT90 n=1 Tax=Penicillium macrosclerotiorum TaxID=303699 RepID=UPI00254828C8|nr:CAZyme family GT90 [Penicillium macrosclerotiorum]KAJ5682332.1 CAZyme family GT90 [Penicillium macrosclerotiorum]